jgi:anti-sigma factor RsiW
MSGNPITETDLQAYVDDQLDAGGRLEVADYLVRNPEVAARVLADLRATEAMRMLARRDASPPAARLTTAASHLESGLKRSRRTARLRWAASVAVILTSLAGIGAYQSGRGLTFSAPASATIPVYVEEAMMSHRTALKRQQMRSQLETPRFDPKDVRAATRIRIPRLPDGWRLRDVQVFPSDYGPSLQIVADGQTAPLFLFAAVGRSELSDKPVMRTSDSGPIACWSRDGIIYVLSGGRSAADLQAAAADLSDNMDA